MNDQLLSFFLIIHDYSHFFIDYYAIFMKQFEGRKRRE